MPHECTNKLFSLSIFVFFVPCVQQRYQLSPGLDMSYIDVARNLEIVTGVAGLYHSRCIDTMHCIYGSDVDVGLVGREKKRSIITLSCLELMLPAQLSHTTSWDSAGLFKSLAERHLLHAEEDREDRNVKSTKDLSSLRFEPLQYLFRDVADLFKRFRSKKTRQAVIINSMEPLVSRMTKYMPYVNRSRRLVKIAHSLHNLAQKDRKLLSALELEDLNAFPLIDDDDEWTDYYNPYDHCDINYCDNYDLGEDMDKSRTLVDMAAKLSEKHSVLKLLIMGRLKGSPVKNLNFSVGRVSGAESNGVGPTCLRQSVLEIFPFEKLSFGGCAMTSCGRATPSATS